MMKAVVLLSAGLDSTVNFYLAVKKLKAPFFDQVIALQFDYGQKAFTKENEKARRICENLNIKLETVSLPFIAGWNVSSLIDQKQSVPLGNKVSIDDIKISQSTARSVWVPNRNGVFLNIAAGFAEAINYQYVIPGFNIEEAQTFSDNSQGFIDSLNTSFSFSTSNKIKIHCYTIAMNKTQIVKLGSEINIDFRNIWPCYQGQDLWCGECESCKRAQRAFSENNIDMGEFFAQ
jgi:7-cyano-7-deazaguanine synthase